MKTPMNVFNTAMKKKKNRKGFSLVELIVVLVIMAILAAALVPTLIGYIKQTRQSNSKNEASSCVSAAQTIASSAYADVDGKYVSQLGTSPVTLTIYTKTGNTISYSRDLTGGTLTANGTISDNAQGIMDTIEGLAEVDKAGGNVTDVRITNGVVKELLYTAKNGDKVKYDGSKYTVVSDSDYTLSASTPASNG